MIDDPIGQNNGADEDLIGHGTPYTDDRARVMQTGSYVVSRRLPYQQ
jgi:hypothetical protein